MNHKTYIDHLDSLRGLFILIIFFSHLNQEIIKPGGVNFFFLLTGYFLIGSLSNKILNNDFNLFDYFSKRLRRLFPSIFLISIIILSFFSIFVHLDNYQILLRSFIYSVIPILNFYFLKIGNVYSAQEFNNPFLHIWAFSIIIQFSFFIGLIFLFLKKLKKNLNLYFLNYLNIFLLTCFFIISILFLNNLIGSFYSTLSRLWIFFLGGFLFYNQKFLFKFFSNNFISLASVLILFLVWQIGFFRNFYINILLVVTLGSILIIIGGKYQIFKSKFLISLGLRSYSFYLLHLPIIYIISFYFNNSNYIEISIISLLLTIIFSYFWYHFIEKPSNSSKFLFSFFNLLSKLFTILIPILLALFLFFNKDGSNIRDKIVNYFFDIETSVMGINIFEKKYIAFFDYRKTYTQYQIGNFKIKNCIDNSSKETILNNCLFQNDSKNLFFIHGTSHAAQHIPMIYELSQTKKQKDSLLISTVGGGTTMDSIYIFSKDDFNNMNKEDAFNVKEISKNGKEVFFDISDNFSNKIIILSERYPFQIQNYIWTNENFEMINQNYSKGLIVLEEALKKEILYFNESSNNNKIILFGGIPEPKMSAKDCYKNILFEENNYDYCDYSISDDKERVLLTNKIMLKVSNLFENVYFFDPYDHLCILKDEKCQFFRDNLYNPIIADGSHITPKESLLLGKIFNEWMIDNSILK